MNNRQTDILKQPVPILLLTFVLLLALVTIRGAVVPSGVESTVGVLSPVGEWFNATLGSVWGVAVSVLATLLGAVIITRIIGRYSLSVIRSFVPMVLLVICVAGVVFPVGSPAVAVALLMLIHSTELMIMSFRRTERFSEVMRATFWSSLAALLIPDLIYIVALLPVQWLIWQRSPREMVAGGIMLPLPLILASFCYWVGGKKVLWLAGEWGKGLSPLNGIDFGALYAGLGGCLPAILLGVLTLLTLASIVVFIGGFGSMRLRARKGHVYFSLLYMTGALMLLGGVPAVVALPTMGFASVPLIHTFFVRRKGLLGVTIYIIMVLLALTVATLPLFG